MKNFLPIPVFLMLLGCGDSAETEGDRRDRGAAPTAVESAGEERLHPDFDFTASTIERRLENLPPAAKSDYFRFLELASKLIDLPEVCLLLVDKNRVLTSDYRPPGLKKIPPAPGILRGRKNLLLYSGAADALIEMAEAADADGILLRVSSAYRPYEYQSKLYSQGIRTLGRKEASRFIARPGASQHQLGTAADFGNITNSFAESAAGSWMSSHAGNYGWSLSYPEGRESRTGYAWESWHWRWIGRDAVLMQNEFFGGSQQQLLEFWQQAAQEITGSRESDQYDKPVHRSPLR